MFLPAAALHFPKNLYAVVNNSLNTRIRCFRLRSIWFENLVSDAMASEACCLLKANLCEDAVALFKSRGLRSFVCVRNVVVLILDISDFALCSDAEAFLSARRFFMQQVSFHGGQCVEATTAEFVVAWGLKDDSGADSEEAREGDVRKAVMVVQAMPKALQGTKVKGAPLSASGLVVLLRFPSQLHSTSIDSAPCMTLAQLLTSKLKAAFRSAPQTASLLLHTR